jgi:putative transposase
MDMRGVRKTYKYRLYPTPEQEQRLDTLLWRCRTLYNVALEERKTAWDRCGVSVGYYKQKAELPDLKRAYPEYAEAHAHVLQDVILRLERTYRDFFRRIQEGEQPGHPRYKGRNRYRSFTFPEYGNAVALDGAVLSLSKIGRIPIKLHRPLEGTPKTVTISRAADGWYACISCVEVPTRPLRHTQDGHHQSSSGRLVCLHLLCGGAHTAAASHRAGDGHRHGPGVVCHASGWRAH